MKKALLALSILVCSSFTSFAQEDTRPILPTLNTASKQFEYEEVINTSGKLPVADQMKNVLSFIYKDVQTSKDKVIVHEGENGITLTAAMKAEPVKGFGWAINTANYIFKIDIKFKEDRVKIFMDNFVYEFIMDADGRQQFYSQSYDKLKNNKNAKKVKAELSSIIYAIRDGIVNSANGATSSKKDENW